MARRSAGADWIVRMSVDSVREIYTSGDCEIDLMRRELRILGSAVPVGGRAFEIIELLVQSAGELVTKSELIGRIWPGVVVSDNTLQAHAAAVRKALGPYRDLLRTEAGRGYRLLGEWTVRRHDAARSQVEPQRPRINKASGVTSFPITATRLIGRSAALAQVSELIAAFRVVTLVGPGGIGKSTLALYAARGMLSAFIHGGSLVELASLSDPNLVASAVSTALEFNLGGGGISTSAIAGAIGDRHLLLILDNCEHVIDAVASLVETLLHMCPHVTILATSRELLRIDQEQVYPVPPLEVPHADDEERASVLACSAVELFVARTREANSEMELRDEDLASVAAICRHLDGIPLAIEFAAASAATFGVLHVAARLNHRFALLTRGRRTALPRHQTLRGALDGSYALLPAAEQHLLQCLAVFSGGFTLAAATAVVTDTACDESTVLNGITDLVDKSLVMTEPIGRWRLLESTREYALEKLAERGEVSRVVRRHAVFYLDMFAPLGTKAGLQTALEDFDSYRREVDNLGAGLNWALSPDGDAALGARLEAAMSDFRIAASVLNEACKLPG